MSKITKYSEVTRKTVPDSRGYTYDSRLATVQGKPELQFYVEWLNDSLFCDGWFFESELELIDD